MATPPEKTETQLLEIEITQIEQALDEAPVMFVDGAHGLAVTGNIVRINLFQDKLLSRQKDAGAVRFTNVHPLTSG